jgi:serine/threonine protein kinase
VDGNTLSFIVCFLIFLDYGLFPGLIMKNLDHPNILQLLGVSFDGMDIFVVSPFMINGDVKSFITDSINVSLYIFLSYCYI